MSCITQWYESSHSQMIMPGKSEESFGDFYSLMSFKKYNGEKYYTVGRQSTSCIPVMLVNIKTKLVKFYQIEKWKSHN